MSASSDFSVRIDGLGKCYVVPSRRPVSGMLNRLTSHLREFTAGLGNATEDERFWALRDISCDLMPGDVIGILGKNGSGKSTLLKILTGVTLPTTGRAVLRGRVGSLLEVGTGFHPDLTGRENVFMSGALLGMSRADIIRKLDAIIAFAGIDDFIDLPVKRYSSGMYVRLAYSVASHLDTDVLILDEVLAVGDAAFRAKSLANMEAVAQDGRTILFVSHSASSVANLCNRGLVLSHGRDIFQGSARDAVSYYQKLVSHIDGRQDNEGGEVDLRSKPGHESKRNVVLTRIVVSGKDGNPTRTFRTGEALHIRIDYDIDYEPLAYFTVLFMNQNGDRVMTLYSNHQGEALSLRGAGSIRCVIPELRLAGGEFSIMLDYGCVLGSALHSIDCIPNAMSIRVDLADYLRGPGLQTGQGYLAQRSQWSKVEDGGAEPEIFRSLP